MPEVGANQICHRPGQGYEQIPAEWTSLSANIDSLPGNADFLDPHSKHPGRNQMPYFMKGNNQNKNRRLSKKEDS